jgi:hypothetical protein
VSNIDDKFELMSTGELQTYIADQLALADRAKEHVKKRALLQRRELADWMLQHRGMFLRFFHLGGCTKPEEAFNLITEYPEQYRPMAYAQRDEL